MRDKIEKILALQGCEGYDAIGEIISLLAPELVDAEKWKTVRKIFFDCSPCTGCTGCDIGSSESCKMVMRINRFIGSDGADALDGKEAT